MVEKRDREREIVIRLPSGENRSCRVKFAARAQ